MHKRFSIFIIIALLLAACGRVNLPGLNEDQPSSVENQASEIVNNSPESNAPTSDETLPSNDGGEELATGSENNPDTGSGAESGQGTPVELFSPDCYGPGVHPVGESIADQFEETNYTQVMTWFCNGAEFEDILMALQTQKLSDQHAEDLLERLANGESWELILSSLGLNSE